jgi:hypothetical protein
MNERDRHEEAVAGWMQGIIEDGGIDRHDDLHVDTIDAQWRDRTTWLDAGLEAYMLARGIRDRQSLPYVVSLAFSLGTSATRLGVNFSDSAGFANELDWSPPSLYLFRPSEEPWRVFSADVVIAPVDVERAFGRSISAAACYLLEFPSSGGEEIIRSLFLGG